MNDKLDVGNFAYHIADPKTDIMKLLIIDTLSDGWFCCQYINYRILQITPRRKFHISELETIDAECSPDTTQLKPAVPDQMANMNKTTS